MPGVLPMKIVSLVAVVSLVANVSVVLSDERVYTTARCSGVVFQSGIGLLERQDPRDAQRVLPQQQSDLRAFFIASLFRGVELRLLSPAAK